MIIRKIKLKFFQQYKDFETTFSALTYIKGPNGSGKTTLGLESIMFCFWGYSSKNLTEIPTRGESKTCYVEAEVEHEGSVYTIKRSIPSHIEIIKDEVKLEFATNTEAQSYIHTLFGEPLNFKKFRMIDNEIGINFLDPKQATTLKKIIFSVSEQLFNEKKEQLQKMKQEREIWNKDNAVLYSYAPSVKRLEILKTGIQKLQVEYSQLLSETKKISSEKYQIQSNIGKSNSTIGYNKNDIVTANKQIQKLNASACYACGQALDPVKNKEMVATLKQGIIQHEQQIKVELDSIKQNQDIIEEITEMEAQSLVPVNALSVRINKINELRLKLEGRLKQKDYIYSTKDVEIVKRAGKELDNLSTKFLVNSVKVLEPIINEVLAKISYKLEFDINEKGKFDINLTNSEGVEFKYKDLSTGQKLLLQIAFKLALLLQRGEEGLLIADEGFGSLDHDNLLHVLTIFSNYPMQLIFIVHHIETEDLPGEIKIIDLKKEE